MQSFYRFNLKFEGEAPFTPALEPYAIGACSLTNKDPRENRIAVDQEK
jgi:hypothetical protein